MNREHMGTLALDALRERHARTIIFTNHRYTALLKNIIVVLDWIQCFLHAQPKVLYSSTLDHGHHLHAIYQAGTDSFRSIPVAQIFDDEKQ